VKSDVETLSPTRVKLTIEVPFDELKPSLDAAYGRIAQNVNIPGFRKGKVPARIIEQRFGRGAVLEEAVNDAIPKAYEDAVRDTKIVPISRPEIDVTAVADQFIGEPAGLGALAAIGAAAAERLAGQALSRIGNAQRAMDKHLQLERRLPTDGGDLRDGEFAGEHHPLHSQGFGEADRLGAGEGHLGGRVERQVRATGP